VFLCVFLDLSSWPFLSGIGRQERREVSNKHTTQEASELLPSVKGTLAISKGSPSLASTK
jgi:hypothetical protein